LSIIPFNWESGKKSGETETENMREEGGGIQLKGGCQPQVIFLKSAIRDRKPKNPNTKEGAREG